MENVVSEIEVVDEGEVARPAIERTCVGPPQATGPQTVKAPAWKIIGNAPSVSQITHQVASLLSSVLFKRRALLSVGSACAGLSFSQVHLVIIRWRVYGDGNARCVRVRDLRECVVYRH